jgi:hypothetical protein
VLPALSLSGVLHLDIVAGSYNAASFSGFIDCLLDNMNRYPGPNSVIVMENASIHKSPALRPMIEQRYVSSTTSASMFLRRLLQRHAPRIPATLLARL